MLCKCLSPSVCVNLHFIFTGFMKMLCHQEGGVNKPLGGKLDDGVELALQGGWTFAHLNVLAVFSDWRVDLSLSPGLGLLQTQKFCGG